MSTLPFTQHYLTKNKCYQQSGNMTQVLGLMLHSTATPGAMTTNFIKSWDTYQPNGRSVCVHAFLDDTQLVQTLPYNKKAWGCGAGPKGSGNAHYIQLEICEPSYVIYDSSWLPRVETKHLNDLQAYVDAFYPTLIEWCAQRLFDLGFTTVTTTNLTSHKEAHEAGLASNHQDPQQFLALANLSMEKIRYDTQQRLTALHSGNAHTPSSPQPNPTPTDPNLGLYKVLVDSLNIRKSPGTQSPITGVIADHGVYTIVATATYNNSLWGQLKSGAGWINIGSRYCKKLNR